MTNTNAIELATELLKDVVAPLPVVDVHTHISPQQPSAADLGEILFYHYIVAELAAAGVSRERLEGASSTDEKIALLVSEQRRLSNTTTFWCLRQVLRSLGMDVSGDLTVESLSELDRRLRKLAQDRSWPREHLLERHNIHKTFLTLGILEELPAFDHELFAGAIRLDDILGGLSSVSLERLEEISGVAIRSLEDFEHAAGKRLSELAASGALALTAGVSPEEDFVVGSRPAAEKLLSRVRKGQSLDEGDRAALHGYLLHQLTGLARDLRVPIQLLLGIRRPLPGDAAVPVLQPGLVVRFAPLFHNFPGVSFDLLLASVAHSQELIAVAKSYPNVSLSGFWWYAFSPPYIRAMLTERLLALPAAKLHGFFSDAYNVEWSAGKLSLIRRELARVLAELIASGYLTESQAPEIARALLYENPARFYGISDANAPRQVEPVSSADLRF